MPKTEPTPDPALGRSCPQCGVSAGVPCRRAGDGAALSTSHKARAVTTAQGLPNFETR